MSVEELKEIRGDMGSMKEALSKIQYIIDEVLVEFRRRIKTLEQHDEDFQTAVYQSCDAKTKEIDTKITFATVRLEKDFDRRINVMADVYDKRIMTIYWVIATLITMFIGAVVYMNNEHGSIHEKVNKVNENVVRNGTNIENMNSTLASIDKKLDKATAQRYYIRDTLKKDNQ